MDVAEARDLLEAASFPIKSESRLGTETGTQLRLKNGGIVNIFDTGKFNVQGKNTTAVEAALQRSPTVVASTQSSEGCLSCTGMTRHAAPSLRQCCGDGFQLPQGETLRQLATTSLTICVPVLP